MLKKLFIILFTAALVFSAVGCSQNKDNNTTEETTLDVAPPAVTDESTSSETLAPRFNIPEDAVLSDTQREAAESAQSHLADYVSRSKLIKVLVEEGYTEEDAICAVDIFGIDWREMARGTAEFYTYYMPFSYQGMIDHLIYMEFTPEEAQYGTDQLETDWDAMAKKYIEKYYAYHAYSNEDLINELVEAGFTEDQAKNAISEYEADMAEDSSLRAEYGLDETGDISAADSDDSTTDASVFNPRTIVIIAVCAILAAGLVVAVVILTKGNSANNKNNKNKK